MHCCKMHSPPPPPPSSAWSREPTWQRSLLQTTTGVQYNGGTGNQCKVVFAELVTDTTCIGGTVCLYGGGGDVLSSLPFPILDVSSSKLAKMTLLWSTSSSMGFSIQLAVGKDSYDISEKILRFFLHICLRIVRNTTHKQGRGFLALNSTFSYDIRRAKKG